MTDLSRDSEIQNAYMFPVADPEGGNPVMAPLQFGYRLFPLQRRNKCEILGNILNRTPHRMSGSVAHLAKCLVQPVHVPGSPLS